MTCYWPNHKDSNINISDTHKSFWMKKNKMAIPDSNFYIQFSEHTAYCCVRVGES